MGQLPNTPHPPAEDPGPGPDLRQYLDVVLKWKWMILGVTLAVVAATAMWTFSRTKLYQANTSVLVNKVTPEVLGSKVREVVDLARESYSDTEEYLQNQVAVACSTAVASRAARQHNLKANRRFWGADRRSGRTLEEAAAMLLYLTRCSTRRKTTILDITVTHEDSALAATLANAMAQAYIEQNLDYKLSSTMGAVQWLSRRLDELRGQLDRSERSLYKFKQDNELLAVPLSGQQNLLTRQIERHSDELTRLRVKRMELGSQLEQLEAIDTRDPLGIPTAPMLDTPVIHRLKMTYVDERRKYLALRQRYLERHPLVMEQKSKMGSAGDDILREVRNRVAGVRATLRQVERHERQLASAVLAVKKQAMELTRKEQAYLQLKRPVDTTSQLYDVLLARMKESDVSGQLRTNNLQLLEPAVASRFPVRPRVRLNLVVGLLLGLLLGLGLAFLLEALDSSVKSAEDIEQVTGLVCLGAVPSVKNHIKDGGQIHPVLDRSPALVVHHRPMSIPAESWRVVRTNLMFSSPDRELKTVVVTSACPQEGKTTIVVGLASAVAQSGKSVVIIDADMRQPRLHAIFELGRGTGLTTALRGEAEVEDLVRTTEVPGLFVLPSGPIPPNPAELCQSERLVEMVQKLAQRYDRVFLDSPPMMLVTDPVLLAARFDATLLVVRTNKTAKKTVQDCHRQLGEVGATVLGCVLNDMDISERRYRYYPYRRRSYHVAYNYQRDE